MEYKRVNGHNLPIGEIMEVTVERVSEFGIMVEGSWKNGDKKAGIKFKGGDNEVHPGDVIELTLNPGGFITAYKLVTSAPPKAAKKPWNGGGFQKSPEDQDRMSRGAAVKAVLSSPVVAQMVKDLSDEEALSRSFEISEEVARYISKGI